MQDTIKSKDGYHVRKVKNIITGAESYRIDDGDNPLLVARKRSYADYQDEKRNNECFLECEVFTTVKGNQFIYWCDEEIDADYITRVPEGM